MHVAGGRVGHGIGVDPEHAIRCGESVLRRAEVATTHDDFEAARAEMIAALQHPDLHIRSRRARGPIAAVVSSARMPLLVRLAYLRLHGETNADLARAILESPRWPSPPLTDADLGYASAETAGDVASLARTIARWLDGVGGIRLWHADSKSAWRLVLADPKAQIRRNPAIPAVSQGFATDVVTSV
jgi:hypothetical protein